MAHTTKHRHIGLHLNFFTGTTRRQSITSVAIAFARTLYTWSLSLGAKTLPEQSGLTVMNIYAPKDTSGMLTILTHVPMAPVSVEHVDDKVCDGQRPNWHSYFMRIAETVALRADCTRAAVGAVIVAENRIISTGYNGAPAGEPGCLSAGACPRGKNLSSPPGGDYSNCISLHAEQNAIAYARTDLRGATMYVTYAPCDMCSKLIRAAGITRTVISDGRSITPRSL